MALAIASIIFFAGLIAGPVALVRIELTERNRRAAFAAQHSRKGA